MRHGRDNIETRRMEMVLPKTAAIYGILKIWKAEDVGFGGNGVALGG
jgi:hypothetical protein